MNIINIQAAKTHLSRIVENVVAGEEIVLAKSGKPLVKLIPFVSTKTARKGGQWAGKVFETSDCWLPDDGDLLELDNGVEPTECHKFPVSQPAVFMLAEGPPGQTPVARIPAKSKRK